LAGAGQQAAAYLQTATSIMNQTEIDKRFSNHYTPIARMPFLGSQFILFGASMTEWSFDKETEGLGWFLENVYRDKVAVVNEGKQDRSRFGLICTFPAFSAFFCNCQRPVSARSLKT
jgi:hypothetical protein